MIVCPGCGGRNEAIADACAFCMRRLAASGRTAVRQRDAGGDAEGLASLAARSTVLRRVLLVVLVLVVLLLAVLLAIRSNVLPLSQFTGGA